MERLGRWQGQLMGGACKRGCQSQARGRGPTEGARRRGGMRLERRGLIEAES